MCRGSQREIGQQTSTFRQFRVFDGSPSFFLSRLGRSVGQEDSFFLFLLPAAEISTTAAKVVNSTDGFSFSLNAHMGPSDLGLSKGLFRKR